MLKWGGTFDVEQTKNIEVSASINNVVNVWITTYK